MTVNQNWCDSNGNKKEKMTRKQYFLPIWGPKWSDNRASGAHILHISKSSSNEHAKQYM